jgi:hypothetical protein
MEGRLDHAGARGTRPTVKSLAMSDPDRLFTVSHFLDTLMNCYFIDSNIDQIKLRLPMNFMIIKAFVTLMHAARPKWTKLVGKTVWHLWVMKHRHRLPRRALPFLLLHQHPREMALVDLQMLTRLSLHERKSRLLHH